MLNDQALFEFIEPYYADKDIMHNMWHIELVQKMINKILSQCSYIVDEECLKLATYFHGFIYKDEAKIKQLHTPLGEITSTGKIEQSFRSD